MQLYAVIRDHTRRSSSAEIDSNVNLLGTIGCAVQYGPYTMQAAQFRACRGSAFASRQTLGPTGPALAKQTAQVCGCRDTPQWVRQNIATLQPV